MQKDLMFRPRIMAVPVIITAVVIISIIEKIDPVFTAVIALWIGLFAYSIITIKRSPLLFCFLIAFFVFLLGRQFCYHYLHMEQVYAFLNETNTYVYWCMIISLVGIIGGMLIASKTDRPYRVKQLIAFPVENKNVRAYQNATKAIFYLCYIALMTATVMQIVFVHRVGYLSSYTEDAGGAGTPTYVSYLARFAPVAFCLFLGSKPSRKKAALPIILYELYAVLTLLTGQRYPFIGVSMLILVYLILRSKDEKGWMKRYYYVAMIVAIPVLMLFLTAYDSMRRGISFSFNNYVETIENFFVQQGGSVNVIRRTVYHADQLKNMRFVSFQSIYSSLFENGISRRLFKITIYSGNSIERALYSNNLAHRLSYIVYGNEYLTGKGTGSSYIGELLHDFGNAGVFLGSLLYGFLLKKIDRIEFRNTVIDGIKLSMIYYLLLAPRGQFDSFIGSVFNLYSLIGFFLVFGAYLLFGGVIRYSVLSIQTLPVKEIS